MPRLNDKTMEENKLPNTTFGYSAVRIDELEATEYTLVTVILDTSGSVYPFKDKLEECLQEVVKSCKFSPRADNLLIRIICFNHDLGEIHGYKLLQNCNPGDYSNILNCGGSTALFDAAETGISATSDYGKTLTDNDFSVNGIIFIITDGIDNHSSYGTSEVLTAKNESVQSENLDSLTTVLVGVNDKNNNLNKYLKKIKDECGFDSYVSLGNASANTLAKLAQFVSKSISAQSQSIGSGPAPVQSISI